MLAQEELDQLEAWKDELLKGIEKQITLKVREEVKKTIVSELSAKIDASTQTITNAVHEVRDELATGNLQTHNLLSNMAEIMNKMNTTLGEMSSAQKNQTAILERIEKNRSL